MKRFKDLVSNGRFSYNVGDSINGTYENDSWGKSVS